jgi:ATP-dependent DNA helicase RecG
VVFPLINGQDALSLRDALSVVHAVQEEHFEGSQVGLFHGSMTREERRRAFEDFRNHRLDVLVATTSIEDGPAVPNVSVVVVEQAARVDLSRLQRIGGYVAGSIHEPQASLVVEGPDAGFQERFGFVERASDGFVINDDLVAEDLKSHLSDGAAPLPRFSFLSLSSDRMLIWRARRLAHQILSKDPDLRQGWSADVGRWVRETWGSLWPADDPSWVCPIQESATHKKRRRRRRRKR